MYLKKLLLFAIYCKDYKMKYLIVGLGNVGSEYENTRHNIGFKILDKLTKDNSISFEKSNHAYVANLSVKGRKLVLIKPTTYMNLSGKALNYWMQKEKIKIDNVLILVDDLALPFGKLRLKAKGSDGGHNGLKNINEILGHNNYARLRFGIGSEFSKGKQIDYVLGEWSANEEQELSERIEQSINIVKSFVSIGLQRTMNLGLK